MTNDEWIDTFIKPAAKKTQDAAEFWPLVGVGPFCAVVNMPTKTGDIYWGCGVGDDAVKIACEKIRHDGGVPILVMDYIMSKDYGDEGMKARIRQIEKQALEEGVAIVGGESSEHGDAVEESESVSVVWVLGV